MRFEGRKQRIFNTFQRQKQRITHCLNPPTVPNTCLSLQCSQTLENSRPNTSNLTHRCNSPGAHAKTRQKATPDFQDRWPRPPCSEIQGACKHSKGPATAQTQGAKDVRSALQAVAARRSPPRLHEQQHRRDPRSHRARVRPPGRPTLHTAELCAVEPRVDEPRA